MMDTDYVHFSQDIYIITIAAVILHDNLEIQNEHQ
jgi:hypothetical protein